MKYIFYIGSLLLIFSHTLAANEITLAQQQFIQNRAKAKVNTYTEYLELIARTKGQDIDTRESYKQIVYLSCGKEGGRTRIYNDLIPPKVLQNYGSMENSIQLESYLNKLKEHYGDSISLSYKNLEVSDVYFSEADNWYFVKVTADRYLTGLFQYGAERTLHRTEDKVDFFVYASLVNNEIKMGGVYGVQPHNPNQHFIRARIVRGSGDSRDLILIGKPLKIDQASLRKSFKRGNEYQIKWEGGLADDIIQVELIPQDTTATDIKKYNSMLNTNSFLFTPTSSNDIGEYQFRVRNISTGKYTQTGFFKVKRKVPLAATIAAAPVAAGAAVILWPDQEPGNQDLPLPPAPTE